MTKLYFRNGADWSKVTATVFTKDEGFRQEIVLKEKDTEGDFILEYDDEKFHHLLFAGDKEEEATSKIYPGNLSLGAAYRWNEEREEYRTYLYNKGEETTGHVDTYIVKDIKHLAYRGGEKKVNVFVPNDYDESKDYEVLYFFDAQNLFCNTGTYTENADSYGGWQLDVVLQAVAEQYGKDILVVGIDNADVYREPELFMNPKAFGDITEIARAEGFKDEGYLDDLSDFIKKTLHPMMKEKYSISDTNIGIGGSSMGGIAAFYCAMKENNFYDYSISISPAYELFEMSCYDRFFTTKNFKSQTEKQPKLYIYCGQGDELEKLLIHGAKEMKDIMVKYGYQPENIVETYDVDKSHNEEAWRLILPDALTNVLDGEYDGGEPVGREVYLK